MNLLLMVSSLKPGDVLIRLERVTAEREWVLLHP